MPESIQPVALNSIPNYIPHETFRVKKGESFSVSLDENGGSTGYVWEQRTDASKTVSFESKNFTPPVEPMPGKPGVARFHFTATNSGTTQLVFELRQPWQSAAVAAQTFILDVTVID